MTFNVHFCGHVAAHTDKQKWPAAGQCCTNMHFTDFFGDYMQPDLGNTQTEISSGCGKKQKVSLFDPLSETVVEEDEHVTQILICE